VLGFADISRGNVAAFDAAVSRWNIRWAILPNRSTALIGVIDRSPGWRRIAQDDVGVVYARTSNLSAS